MRGPWALFHAGEVMRCPSCGRAFGELASAQAMVRIRPDVPDAQRVSIVRRCERCSTTLDVLVIDTRALGHEPVTRG